MEKLKLPAALCLMLGSYPAWYWLCAWQMRPAGEAFAFLGISLLLTLLAAVHRHFDAPLGRRSLLAAAVLGRIAAVAVGIGGFFVVRMWYPQSGAAGAGVIFWAVYLVSWELLRPIRPAESLLSVFSFIVVCTAWFLGMLMCFLQGGRRFDGICWIMLAATAAIFAVLRNLLMLRGASGGRTGLPRGFYRYNMLLTGGFLVPGAAVLLLGGQIIAGIRTVLQWIGGWLRQIVRMLSALLVDPEWFTMPDDELPAQRTDALAQGMAVIALLINLAVIAAAVFFLIRCRRELWELFRGWLRDLLYAFRRLTRLREPEIPPEVHAEYTDAVELLDAGRSTVRFRKPPTWRRRYRKYKRMPAGAMRFREGYALWLNRVQALGAELTAQDTPRMQLDKSGGIPDKTATAAVNAAYYRIRYGSGTPTAEEAAQLDAVLRELAAAKVPK